MNHSNETTFLKAVSGIPIDKDPKIEIHFGIYDFFNQIISIENNAIAQLKPVSGSELKIEI